MKAKYLGNPAPNEDDDGPRRVSFGGKSFPRDVFIDVSDATDHIKGKLAAHPNFEVSDDDLTEADIAAADAVNGAADTGEVAEAADATPGDKLGVITALEDLQKKHPEVKFNPRWGLAKLQETLEAARFEHGDDE